MHVILEGWTLCGCQYILLIFNAHKFIEEHIYVDELLKLLNQITKSVAIIFIIFSLRLSPGLKWLPPTGYTFCSMTPLAFSCPQRGSRAPFIPRLVSEHIQEIEIMTMHRGQACTGQL